jgi:hypothetical protein
MIVKEMLLSDARGTWIPWGTSKIEIARPCSGPHITGDEMGRLKDHFGLGWANDEYEKSRVIRCTAPHDQCPAISR